MKRIYLSAVIICLTFSIVAPIPATVYAETTPSDETTPNSAEEQATPETPTPPPSETDEKEATKTEPSKDESTNSSDTSANKANSDEKETTTDKNTTNTNAKEQTPTNQVLAAGDTFIETFPDEAFAKVIALQVTGSDDTSQVVTQSQLDSVTTLDASSKNITDVTGINELTNLTSINLSENQLTSIAPITGLSALSIINLSDNLLNSVDLTSAQNLPNLSSLNLSDNPTITKISIVDQPKLATVDATISNGQNSLLKEINLSNLPVLTLAGKNFSNLVNFSSYSTELTTVNLASLPKIGTVDLSSNNITDINIQDMIIVNYINLETNKISDINNLVNLPALTNLQIGTNQLSVLPTNLETEAPALQTLFATNQIITLPNKVVTGDLSIPNEVSNNGVISTPTSISNSGVYADGNVNWDFDNIKNLSSVSYSFSEALNYTNIQGTFFGTVTQPITVSVAPVITADDSFSYPKSSTVTETEFLRDINATTSDGSPITSDFATVVDFSTPGDYTVTLNSVNTEGAPADPVTVTVTVEKAPAPVITADNTISYPKNSTVDSQQFLTDMNATTDDGSPITSDFATVVDFTTPGNYTVTLNSVNSDGVAASPVTVTVTVEKDPAPVITADSTVSYPKNSTVDSQQFFDDINATTDDGSPITSDFDTVVDFSTAGNYTVTLNSVNSDGVAANPVTVMVTVEKDPAPIITADSEITYMKNSTISSAQFLTDISATTNDGSPITSDFATVVDFATPGDYTVTLNSVNSDGVAANPVTVTVTVEKAPAPVITADSTISYPKNSTVDSQQFYTDVNATTDDGSPITSDFDTVVDFSTAGNYTVTLNSVNSDGVEANPVTVTVTVEKAPAPVITADSAISYPKNSTVDSQQFYTDVDASTDDGSSITSDFDTVVDFTTAGDYTVTLNSVNSDGVAADPVTVTVTVEKAPAPIITADNEITYMKNSTISSAQFLTDISATTNDGSPITSDFDTVVDFTTAGDYTVTLQSLNSDGVAANPLSVIVHIAKDPAPVITADSAISYPKNSTVDSQQFYTDVSAATDDGSPITSDFATVVDFTTPGDYTVTLNSVNSDGVAANPVTVTVTVEKAPAPVITADNTISYPKNSTVDSEQFLTDINATTDDDSPITSDFATVVDFANPGDYTVTLNSVNSDGVAASPFTVTVTVEKAPAPVITADSAISYPKNSTVGSQQFYTDVDASTDDGSPITSDFDTVVDFTTAGDYTVTLNSVNSDGVEANPVTVTVTVEKAPAPVITADSTISYPKNSTVDSQQFYTDVDASTDDGSPITSDFDTVVDFATPGDYTVTLNSVNSDGVAANPVTVTVTVEKAPAPIITADSEITYMKNSTISSTQFLTDISATTNDGSPITSDFDTVVDFTTAGDYTVTLQSLNSDGVAANPLSVIVHIAKDPAPVITADSAISYPKNSTVDSQQFYTDVNAATDDGSSITSDFDTVVDFSTPGDYTVTLNSVNSDGVAANPVTVTVTVEKAPAPVITADSAISYPKNSTVDSQQFYTDVDASTDDGSLITSDFDTVVDFTTAGDYTVTLNSVNSDGVAADPVTVTVTVEKAPAPVITADSEITYMKHSTISSAQFLTDVNATTNDGSPITSDFATVVDFETAGDYTVTLQSLNSDGVAASPVTTVVHVEKDPAPVITADNTISYPKNSTIDSQQFYTDVNATTDDGSAITSDFATVVDFTTAGNYTVTLNSVNSDGVAANPVTVIVTIEKAPAPVITADSEVSYPENSTIDSQQFLTDINATTDDSSPITSDFATVVDFSTAGDYTVTLNSVNSDGVTANPVTVTVTIEKAPAPVITADNEVSYPENSTIDSQQFLTDIHASTSDGSPITSDFATVIDFSTAGDYTVTLNSVNSDGVAANPVTVTVHVEKAPAPVITADNEVSYPENSTINSQQFLTDINATTNDGSPITSDFATAVDFSTAGDYTVTLQSVNADGVAANPVTVIVHIEKAPAPIITADSKVSYPEKSKITAAQFYKDIHAKTNDGSSITSDFDTIVNFQVAGDYKVTLRSVNADGVAAKPVTVTVHIEKAPAPVISTDSEISYKINSKVDSQQFYKDIHAITNDGSTITSDFDTVVNFAVTGDYTVTLQAINSDGVAADPVKVIVHVTANEPTPTPTPPTPPNNGNNSGNNTGNTNNPTSKSGSNTSLPSTGDTTTGSSAGILLLLIACSLLYASRKNKHTDKK
ncbi:LapB repeat-containing protein [Listeria seeligeri]|uniref:LapB repeat-containing protein n=1 Tax=Listeria seeligeri TaxID=1640 RepID=UPI001628A83D|nr:LapB repeat-containing protein [Listeria seeligeri]MBC1594782.1 LapB repeat-containing protein [Listeria seeligeri]MBC2211327.1 LapB repeat-containing protein [Listeria seeligeri]MBF2375490.1 LapB repeat-containing protein [Listeria seeligeri]MBF2397097.1 LapB repeat-containing protein [Listeria seeligeri]MBF2573074.1 LapB repeat-containing protein [Listeria seeligeri]